MNEPGAAQTAPALPDPGERIEMAKATHAPCSECGASIEQHPTGRVKTRCDSCCRPRSRPALQPCGTPAAYRRHRKLGEDACAACRAAYNERCLRLRRERIGPVFSEIRTCLTCEATFEATLPITVYCSAHCRHLARLGRRRLNERRRAPDRTMNAWHLATGAHLTLQVTPTAPGSGIAWCPAHAEQVVMRCYSTVIRFCGCGLLLRLEGWGEPL